MGQDEVLNYLIEKRELSEEFFTARDIQMGLKDKGFSNGVISGVHTDLYKLISFKIIEWKGKGLWNHRKLFRAKLRKYKRGV